MQVVQCYKFLQISCFAKHQRLDLALLEQIIHLSRNVIKPTV